MVYVIYVQLWVQFFFCNLYTQKIYSKITQDKMPILKKILLMGKLILLLMWLQLDVAFSSRRMADALDVVVTVVL